MRKLIVLVVSFFVSLPVLAVPKAWTGSVSSNWSNPQNWSPQAVPLSGEDLLFPAGPPTTLTNDLPAGTIVGAMTFNTAYTLNGNPLTLTGDLSTSNVLNCNVDLKLGSSLHLAQIPATYNGAIDVNGQTLSINGSAMFNGAVNGSGAIVITGSAQIKNGGTFSGTLNAQAVDVQGVMPGANITTSQLSGNGTVGTVNGGHVFPGVGFSNTSPDYLHTKTLTASGLGMDLNADGISDKVLVTGTVTLSGSLQVSVVNGSPAAGQTFTIIDNDGTDLVNGTFSGLPEGATVDSGLYRFHISYAGGDGNDVVLTTLSSIKTWTGAVSSNWSNPQNWSPQAVPLSGEELGFPIGPPTTMTNDLPVGTIVGAMTFETAYTLNGNPLTLMGDLSTSNVFNCNVDLKLGSSLHLAHTPATYNGAIDVNGQTLSIDGSALFNGAVNGSGAIVITGSAQIKNGGTFSGTLNAQAVDVQGVMPGANITATQLSGNGTVGTVSGRIFPGVQTLNGFDPHSVDYLHTKTLMASGLSIDLNADGISDKVLVTGTVILSGSLQLSVVNGSPTAGQTFTIIDNDGSDPVNGSFNGLPEGATVPSGFYRFRISYAGGDGNDVVLTTLSGIKTWTGAVSSNWSNPQNWSPQAVPSPGEELGFPLGPPTTMTNDLPAGSIVGAMTFDTAYTLNGNPLTLMGDLSTSNVLNCNVDLKLGSSLHLAHTPATYNGAIDVNGQTLSINGSALFNGAVNGSGAIVLFGFGTAQIKNGGSFSGTLNAFAVDVQGVMPGANITTTQLSGNGTVGTVSGRIFPGVQTISGFDPHSVDYLHTKTLTASGLDIDLNADGISDKVLVTGTVTLSGQLQVSIVNGSPAGGQTFTIIDNDGTDAVNGNFTGLPEGATVVSGVYRFRISYAGGDGNDVVITTLIDTTAALSQSAITTAFGELVVLTTTVIAQSGTATGSVMFTSDGISIGTVPLQNGVATLNATALVAGTHIIVANFLGTGAFADSVSGSVSHVITRGQTTAQIATDHQNTNYGQVVRFTVTVSAQAPAAGQPTGSVTLLADGVPLGTASVVSGTATFETTAPHPGVRSITATYSGDANFDGSAAPAIQQNIGKAQTEVDARTRSALVGESPLITVFVNVIPGSALVPTGAVSISEGGSALGTQLLSGGVATVSLNPLAPGAHTLLVNYSGDTDFEASSATIVQTVGAPGLSVHGVRVLEGNRGITSVSLVVSLSAPVSQTVRVTFSTVAGSATAGEDYESASGVIEFAPGELTHAIELHVIGDTFPESDETFSVLLSNPVNATIDTPAAMIVIANDDQVPPRHRASGH